MEGFPQIKQIIAPYEQDLWLRRKSSLDEIIKKLIVLETSMKAGAKDLTISGAATYLHDFIRFLQFLEKECAGEPFTDERQWSQLMNLMQISRKLNHKSVKFKDILSNRQLIEERADQIKQYNEQARLGCTIVKMFETFESNLSDVELVMVAQSQDGRHLAEIVNCQRNLDMMLKPVINNLRVCLQKSLQSASNQFDIWSKKLELFSQISRALSTFICNYLELKTELTHLQPLVDNILDSSRGTKSGPSSTNNVLIEDCLTFCKIEFQQVLEYEKTLETLLRNSISADNKMARTQIVKKPSATLSRPAQRDDQQVKVKLAKLLKSNQRNRFSNDAFDVKLVENLEKAKQCREMLDKTMSSLRLEFGRFYFVNDLELLTIIALDASLAACSEQPENQRLISKLFSNSIQQFILNKKQSKDKSSFKDLSIVGVRNAIGEEIYLSQCQEPVPLMKRVNVYSLEIVRILQELLRKLQRSLCSLASSGMLGPTSFSSPINWSLPVQLLELTERIKFTQQVEVALLKNGSLQTLRTHYVNRIASLVETNDSEDLRSKFIQELKRSVIVSLSVHFLSILLDLMGANVKSKEEWRWQKLPRYYLHTSATDQNVSQVGICLAGACFQYRFDLLPIEMTQPHSVANPNIKTLIYSKTTERCFLASSRAIGKLKMGASPYGPAGSGKTETVKALGHLLGCQVVVHCCDEANDCQSLERLIWGLAHTGLWGCFDEFNRLDCNTLSSVSGMLEIVQSGLRSAKTTLALENGQMKSIHPDSAFFITLNPSDGKQYRGRRRLPANLRSLFLSVAMVQVQVGSIVREELLAFGATIKQRQLGIDAATAERFGVQVANWTRWAHENLRVNRCQWDLRFVMTILKRFKTAVNGVLEDENHSARKFLVETIAQEVRPRLRNEEFDLAITGLKLVFDDSPDRSTESYSLLQQLEDQLECRSGVILLGPSRSGKTSLWRALLAKKNDQHGGKPVVSYFHINPKSCKMEELLGSFQTISGQNHSSDRWSDGLLTRLVRNSITLLEHSDHLNQVWVVLDGPLDPDWIESLNSVLDDNQVLTLSSGERLKFVTAHEQTQRCIKLIFETESISNVSPATISRLGLINLDHADALRRNSFQSTTDVDTSNTALVVYPASYLGLAHTQNQTLIDNVLSKLAPKRAHGRIIEFACFENATSKTLVDLLSLVNTNDGKGSILLLHNLHLIQSEDAWQTRTLIELLIHIMKCNSYYDSEFILRPLSSELQIVATFVRNESSSNPYHSRLVAAAGRHFEIDHGPAPSKPAQTISSDELARWCNRQSTNELDPTIILVKEESSNEEHVLKILVDRLQNDPDIEVLLFNNSTSVIKSLEYLSKLTDAKSAVKPSDYHKKRPTILLSSLEVSLMAPSSKAQLYHALSLIRMREQLQLDSIDLRCLLVFGKDSGKSRSTHFESDYCFWLRLALIGTRMESVVAFRIQSWREIFDSSKLEEYFTKRLDRSRLTRDSLSWLAVTLDGFFKRDACWASVRHLFLDLLVEMISSLDSYCEEQIALLARSLDQLATFEITIETIKAERHKEEGALAEKQLKIQSLLLEINQVLAKSQSRKGELEGLRVQQTEKENELAGSRAQVEQELAKVLPSIEKSKRDIAQCLRPEALNEIKSLRAPPKKIKDILDVLFIILLDKEGSQTSEVSWSDMKSYLTRFSLREEMTTKFEFQKRLANERLLTRIGREIELRKDSFRPDQAERASNAIVPIVRWIQAAREYGHVLTQVRPLTECIARFEGEHLQLSQAMQELELEQRQLDDKIQDDRSSLTKLEADYSALKQKLDEAKLDAERARDILKNLDQPIQCWKEKLARFSRLTVNQKELLQICLICADIAITGQDMASVADKLNCWKQLSGVKLFHRDSQQSHPPEEQLVAAFLKDELSTVLDSATNNAFSSQCNLTLLRSSASRKQLDHLVKMLVCKLNCTFKSSQLMHLSASQTMSSEELMLYLSYEQVLVSSPDQIIQMPSFSGTFEQWQQEARLIIDSNKDKLLLMEMPKQTEQLLDILDFSQHNLPSSNRLFLFDRTTPERSLLFRHLSDLATKLRGLNLRTPEMTTFEKPSEVRKLEQEVADCLIDFIQPELSRNTNSLKSELIRQHILVKQSENDLLNNLMTPETALHSALSPSNQLVRHLLDLNQSSELLSSNIRRISERLNDLQKERDKYKELVGRASRFYADHLASLDRIDSFYHFSPRSFVRSFVTSLDVGMTNYALATIKQVLCAMRPCHRQKFEQSLLEEGSNSNHNIDAAAIMAARQEASDLTRNLSRLASSKPKTPRDTAAKAGLESVITSIKLAVILHDSRKSSPQMEIDELFGGGTSKARSFNSYQYHKLYGSSASARDLEKQLDKIWTKSAPSADEVYGLASDPTLKAGPQTIKVICIMNAHLAASWINSRLMETFQSKWFFRNDDRPDHQPQTLLVILVAECDETDRSTNEHLSSSIFESNLLEKADLRFWFDELSLQLPDRFQRYKRMCLGEESRDELAEQLILFHVVCQELTRGGTTCSGAESATTRWSKPESYCFDYEMLNLALKVLHETSRVDSAPIQQQTMLCDQLEFVVYGARLEAEEDEALLKRLIENFLRSSELSRQKKVQFRKLAESGPENYSKLMEILINVQ